MNNTHRSFSKALAIALIFSQFGCSRAFDLSSSDLTFSSIPSFEEFLISEGKTEIVYPKTDILQVVDNSGSMAIYQDKIKAGFSTFANSYFKNNDRPWRLGSITTDTYKSGTYSGSSNAFGPNGGACYGLLLPGVHDGPRPNVLPLNSDCTIIGGSSTTGHSLNPITEFKIGAQYAADNAALISQYQMNSAPGTSGDGSERGVDSLLKFLDVSESRPECASDNPLPNCFYRKSSYHGVILLSDEHDSSDGNSSSAGYSDSDRAPLTDDQINANATAHADILKNKLDAKMMNLFGNKDYFVLGIVNDVCNAAAGACGLAGGLESIVTNITQTAPIKVYTSTNLRLNNGDRVEMNQVGGMTQLNAKQFLVTNVAVNVSINSYSFDLVGTDGTSYNAYTPNTGKAKVMRRYAAEAWGPEYVALINKITNDVDNKYGSMSRVFNILNADYSTLLNQLGQDLDARAVKKTTYIIKRPPPYNVVALSIVLPNLSEIALDINDVTITGNMMSITGVSQERVLAIQDPTGVSIRMKLK